MKAFIVISIILLLLIWLYIARNWKQGATFYVPQLHKEMLETFAVLGGQNDVRYGRIGSTLHNTGTLGKWIKVASFVNVNPMQNHALTLDVFPQNKGLGTSKQSFSFLVRNSTSDQDGDPVFIQQNQYDGTNWTKATFSSASVTRTQDPNNKLLNAYDLYLQLGTENAFGIPVTWYLNDFVDTDVIAVGDVDQVDAPSAGTNVYKPRVINQDQAQAGQTGQFPQVTSDKLQLGKKWLLSGVGDKDANDEWLRLKGLDASTYYGGLAAGKLWSAGDVSSGGKVSGNQVQLGNKWLLSGVGDGDANDEWLRLKAPNGKDYYGGFAAGKGWFGSDVSSGGRITGNQVQLGNKWLLSGVGDGDANDDWLRLKGLNGKDYYGGFAAGKGWFGNDVSAQGTIYANRVCNLAGNRCLNLWDAFSGVGAASISAANGSKVAIQDDGNLVRYRKNNSAQWASGGGN